MAKTARSIINLKCGECNHLNYQTTKNTKPETGKNIPLELKKYCKWCKKHTLHKETK